jgi:hypothetical protein
VGNLLKRVCKAWFFAAITVVPALAWGQDATPSIVFPKGGEAYGLMPSEIFQGMHEGTIECWVKWDEFENWSRVFDCGRRGQAILVQIEKSSPQINFSAYDASGVRYRIRTKKDVKQGIWYHIAAVTGPGGMRFYLNGTLVGWDKYAGSVGSLTRLTDAAYYIARSNWPDDGLFVGSIADLRVWKTLRTQRQVVRNMNSQLLGSEAGLVAYWKFDGEEGMTVADQTGNENDLLVFGAARRALAGDLKLGRVATETLPKTNSTSVEAR